MFSHCILIHLGGEKNIGIGGLFLWLSIGQNMLRKESAFEAINQGIFLLPCRGKLKCRTWTI